jgi:hypothetical protein
MNINSNLNPLRSLKDYTDTITHITYFIHKRHKNFQMLYAMFRLAAFHNGVTGGRNVICFGGGEALCFT